VRRSAPPGSTLGAAVALLLTVSAASAAEEVKTIPTRPAVTQAFLLGRPDQLPIASVVLFAGGSGLLNLGAARRSLMGNFLLRTRGRFVAEGLLVAAVDAPSDRPNGLDGFRTSAAHAEDVGKVIAALRGMAPVPVWLVGTSMGTVSAANAAARLGAGNSGPDGLVLTSTVTREGRERPESVGDVRLGDVRVPTLIVHHRQDACRATPYADMPSLLRDFKQAPRRELISFDGGDPPQSGPCEARSAHGYVGLEAEVVAAIVRWITASR
jgi:predicted alpha/beta-hydrolase family hydrolase